MVWAGTWLSGLWKTMIVVGQNRRTRRVQSDTRLLGRTGNYTKDPPPPHPCRLTGLCLPHSQLVLLASDGCYNRAEAGLGLAQLPHGSQKLRACDQASLFCVKCFSRLVHRQSCGSCWVERDISRSPLSHECLHFLFPLFPTRARSPVLRSVHSLSFLPDPSLLIGPQRICLMGAKH